MTYLAILILIILSYLFFKSRTDPFEGVLGFTSISKEEAKEIIENVPVKIIDVRTALEVSKGMIKDAVHINLYSNSFRDKINQLDKEFNYLVYCRSGVRSAKACKIMSKAGIKNIYNLKRGYNKWN